MNIFQEKIGEIRLQKAVQKYLSDPSVIFHPESKTKVQVLSPGRINPHEGPDFLDFAMLMNGKIIVGDAEFHHRSSLWKEHKHSNDPNYKSVIMHIVLDHDMDLGLPFETLVVPEKEIITIYKEQIDAQKHKPDIFSLEELQNFSLIRLLRHTTEMQKFINEFGLESAIGRFTEDFLKRYLSKRRRPAYNLDKLALLPELILRSEASNFVKSIAENRVLSIPDKIVSLMRERIAEEGAGLRREIILNVILPAALTQADEEARINLFVWYWSVQSLNKYGVLTRKFPELPQNYLWQQQGMLEYMREIETGSATISDALAFYGIGKLLSFFQWGPAEGYSSM
jgi:hypothetical protein